MSFLNILSLQLLSDESKRFKPYSDTAGKISIGIGRNLTDSGLSNDEIELMFQNDLNRSISVARQLFVTFDKLTDARKAVLCNMAFNLGLGGLGLFHGLIHAVGTQDYKGASDSMMNSLWAKQVGSRATRLANQMRLG